MEAPGGTGFASHSSADLNVCDSVEVRASLSGACIVASPSHEVLSRENNGRRYVEFVVESS